jgi:hypothetical protein
MVAIASLLIKSTRIVFASSLVKISHRRESGTRLLRIASRAVNIISQSQRHHRSTYITFPITRMQAYILPTALTNKTRGDIKDRDIYLPFFLIIDSSPSYSSRSDFPSLKCKCTYCPQHRPNKARGDLIDQHIYTFPSSL